MLLVTLASVSVLALVPQEPRPATENREESWDALARAYEDAHAAWNQAALAASRDPEGAAERPPHPAPEFWERFEALAARGEGRAVLWQLTMLGPASTPATLSARAATLFERVRAAGDAGWVALALPLLLERELGGEELAPLLTELARESHPLPLRVQALLGLAHRLDDPSHFQRDARAAAEPRLQAASLHLDGRPFAPEPARRAQALEELAGAVLARQAADEDDWDRALVDPATRRARVLVWGEPYSTYRPMLLGLARAGSARARLWRICDGDANEEALAERREYLAAARGEPQPDEALALLTAGQVETLLKQLGPEPVEAAILSWIETAGTVRKPTLAYALARALCRGAGTDAARRERGLALAQRILADWPAAPEAERARGLATRYTQLLVGARAPDFEAVDADGVAFKLSDYRGKVTVVDFWGFW